MDHSSPSGTWLPLSFAQRSRWFACRLDPAQRGWHNNGFSARIRGTLDAAALSAALTRLAARHPMLRTRFREIDGEPEQCVTELVQIAVTEERLEARDAAGLPARVRAGFAQAFDPAQPQRLRATLYRGADPDGDVLALAFDHLAVDGWSYWRLLEELGRLLADPLAADAAPAAPTYNDYISWQRDWLAGERAEAQWRYWRERFDGAPLLQLPSDRKRTGRRAAARRSITVMLDDGEARTLRALARGQGSSLFAALLAGYFVLLHRHTGQDDIVVGTPLPGRSRKWENVVGDFVNPVGLRVRLGAGEDTAGVLRTVRSATFGAMRHADYPFPSLVERLRPGRGADTHPLFQTMFTFQNARSDRDLATLFHADGGQAPVPWGARALAPFPAHQTGIGGHMPLALEAIELGSGIRCDLHYDPDVYDEATVRRLGAHYRRVLAGMAAEPERAVDTLDLMDEEERALVLGGFHGLPRDYGDTGLIHRLVEQRAAAAPESIALVAEGQSTSYGELNRHANAIAHRLLALGVQPDDRVALCARRGIDMVAGMLGVLKAGAAYVPLDPDYPAERLAFVLGDCAPVALLAQPDLLARLPATAAPVLTLDTLNDAPEEGHACTCDPVVPGLASSHLAYIIYTSGSTGRPKGVMVGHRNVTRLLAATAPRFSFRADDVWSLFHSFAFDFSVWELWMPLSAGARVVIVSAACARAPDAFYALLCREGVTVLNQTPSAFRQLIAAEANSTARHRLRCIVFGGEALELRMLAPWVERNDPAVTRLVNMYGITETTVHVSHRDIGSADVAAAAGSLIGAPIPDLTIRILDANLNPVPIGVAGEIHVGGAGLARGYFNMPDLTAQRFVRDPHDPAPDARLYRSGDLARWRADGDIEYLGRNDFQVKIRGFRIELGEIEAKLAACAGVRDAVVVARADAEGGANLVGYVVASDGAQLPVAALRDELALVLPAHMVPAAIVALDAFPLTPNGKLDRAALPQPDRSAVARTAYAPPQGEDEVAMARLWQELLGLAQVGRHDDFFDIGGHSLLATRLLARIRKAFGAEVALVDLFAQPTLAQVTRLAGRRAGVGPAAAFAPQRRDARAAVSLGQQRLWFLDQVDPQAGAAYRMPAAWRLTGRLDKAALRAALDALVARHEVLRTSFPAVDGVPVQAVAPAAPFALSEHDLSEVPAPALEAAVEAFCAAETQRPFDLAAGPLFRGALLTSSEDAHVLVLVQHHAVSDAWSVRLLFAELAALYDAICAGRPNPLAPLALQYADFAQWQRGLLDGTLLDQQALYWQGQLAGAPVMLQLPTDRPRPARATYAGGHCTTVLAPELVRNLEALGRRHGATPFMVHVAAWGVLMARLAGQDDVVVGTPSANRRLAEWEPLIGFFVNTLALRLRLDGDPTVAQLLAQAKATALAALANQDMPFEQVVDAVNPPRSLAHAPLFQVMLTMDDTPGDAEAALAGLKMERLAPGRRSAQFDLTLALRRQGDRLHAELEYASDLFEEATARRFLRHWERLLAGMAAAVAGPDLPVSRLPLLDAADVAMLARFNDTAMPWPRERLLHQSFEAHALAHPELTALTWHAGTLSYGALNARANRIAHRIMALGVRPDDRVALCAERTPDMVAALLGILKAGAAYVPLDPAYPTERLAYMLADCAPAALLCQAATCDRVDAGTVPCIVLDADARLDGEPDHDPVAADLGPAHLAYLIYTSGSTGQPKGVMVEHRNAVAFIAWAQATFTAKQLDLTLFSTSINFDLAVFELFLPLSSGRPLALVQNVLCGNDELSGASLINTVPSAIDVLLKAGWVPSTARLVNLAGEPLRRRLVERLFADTQVDTVGNLYGPSETTTYSTYVLMPRAGGFQPHIGRPVGNTQVHILDAHQMQVPVGVVGELYIGGAGVARGYLNRPALSAERFLPDPFAAEPDARMYRTGDLGRWLADGNIEYLGRNDFQVKIRGFRIELGEIEAKLGACAGVQEAVVVAREDAQGELRLVAYAVAQPGADPAPDGLRAALSARLPGYMVPAALIVLDAWPLTPNGKLDRAALPPPDLDTRRAAPDTPHAGLEAGLAALWQALLGVPLVGRDDNFFDIGGHSLLAVQLVARMREVLGIDVALADVFTHPVLAALAARAAAAAPHAGASIPVLADADAYPLSDLQTRLWLAQRLDPHGSAYNIAALVALPASVQFDTLARVLAVLAERHAALRTVFALRDGVPVQAILPSIKTPLEQALAGDADALAAMAARHARIAFDLERGPLFGARLVHAWDGRKLLLWNMHHLVGDGTSLAVLRREMLALLAGGAPLPAASPVRHVDAGAWQSALLFGEAGGRGAVQRAYWRARLDGVPTLELPYDRPAAARTGTAGAACRLALDPDQVGRLRALAARHQATLFMVLASGFAMLLGRLSGQDDVCIGMPVAGRTHPDMQDIVGCFINTVVLRQRIAPATTVAALLREVRAATLDALANQDYPFERLLEELGLERAAVVPAFLNLVPLGGDEDAAGPDAGPHRALSQDVKFDLNLYVYERGDGLVFDCHYRSACFEAATIEYVLRAYLDLLPALADADDRTCASFDLFALAPRQALPPPALVGRARVLDADADEAESIPARFARQVALHGERVAVRTPHGALSYRQLDAASDALARVLVARAGAGEGRVALLFEHDTPMIVGLLGALKAGKTYVPLDPAYPEARLAYMLDNAQAGLLVAHGATFELAQRLIRDHDILVVDVDADEAPDAADAALPATIAPDTPAYILYTSGSTGQPKGVVQSHRNALYFCRRYTDNLRIDASDRLLLLASYSFDAAVMDVFGALLNGAALYPVDPRRTERPALLAWMAAEAISIYHSTPTLYRHLFGAPDLRAPAALRLVVLGGEGVTAADVARFQATCGPGAVLVNGYGPTESTLALQHFIEHAAVPPANGVPAGFPVAGTGIALGAPGARPHAFQRGEIIIESAHVALGYWNDPAQTARAFGGAAARRWYRSGDIGRYRIDGSLVVEGRIDHQVKIRGFRVELGEVEAVLKGCAGVRDALVVARASAAGPARLVAYLIAGEEGGSSIPAMRAHLLAQLPDYMVPGAWVTMDVFPQTPSGKLDRSALPAPDEPAAVAHSYEASHGAAEEALAAAWSALLGFDRIGRHDHFFELGGDSLLAVTLVERLRQDGWTVPVREVFARPVLADLAAAMTASVDAAADGEVHGIPADATRLAPALAPLAELDQDALDRVAERIDGGVANIQDVYRLAPLQEGILFHHRSQAEGDAYLLHIVLEFADRRRLDDFVGALQQVIDRHDILRSCMQWEDLPHPVQVVCRRAPLPVREAALPGAGAAALAALVDATDPHAVRLDVRRAPLLGATAGQDGEGRWMLALLAHHLVCDHVTLELVMEEVHALLDGAAAALPAALPYRRFIAGLAHEDQDAHAAYFRSRLADVDAPSAPFDVLEVRADAAAVTETRVALDDVLAARVRAAARKHQVGPAALCHLAWAAVLSRFCGRDDVVFGTVLLGRMQDLAQGQRMVGMFINALPLRVRLDGDVAPALRAVHEELAELLRHEQAPLPLALRCSGVAAPLPLFTTMFNYRHSAAGRRLAGADWQGMRVLHARERTNYPVTASVDDFHDGFELRVLAVEGIDGALLAQALHGALAALTRALDQDAAAPLAQIDIFDAAQRARLVDAVNDTRCDYEDDALMHALFERQAAARPLAPALCIGAHAISYGELNRRANLVAQRLGGMGVAPGTRVALCATRGMDMVAGLLGILKAGGAYVPLDPAHPPSRMDYMLADSAPAVVLCGAALRARFGQERPVLVLEEAITDGADPGNPCPRALGLEAGHLAYLIYTSGSTGQPKGVMIQHRPAVNLIEWVNRRFAVNHADKLLFTTSVCFDLSVYDMFGTLAAGACVRIAREDDLADPDRLLGILADEGITFWDSAPAVFGQLRPALARRAEVATSLRLAFFSGDWIALDLPDVVRRAFPRCQVVSLGGATEATVWSNYYPVAGVAPHWTSIPYGKPIANARYYVLDRHLRPCPVGVAGDLYIGGACLSAGYWNKPALSAERFVSDPFAGGDGRMYRSGDRARYWQDGNLEFLGRLDGQVKIRGYRVELSEIEACLLALDGVRDAVVLARPDGAGGSRLVAYVVADERHGPASLRGALEAALPAYMVPGAYVRLERLPLTANGKVDRAALPEPGDAAVAVRAYAAPQGAAEETLAALWRTLLALDRVGRHDHFFELGGHSLLVVRLVEGLRPLGFAAEVLDVFERPVLSDLAARLAADRPARAAGAGPDRDADEEATDWRAGLSADALAWLDGDLPGGLDNVEDAYPLAPLQEAMLVHHEMNQGAGGDAYLMRVVLEADSAARAAALLAALRTLVERHSVLRTTLRWRRLDTPLQLVLRRVHLDVAWLDLAPGDDAEAVLDRASDPRTTRLALDAAPLLRVIALRQADGRCRLALLYHHAVCDHVTLEVLMEQVGNLMRDPGAALAPSRAYRHFVRRWRAQPADAQRAYFTRELGDVQTPTAPFGLRDIHGAGARVAETYREVPDPLACRIERCARRQGASPAVLFHVAWARVLARLANRDDVVFGTVLSGRMQGDLGADRALGMFINALPLRVRLDGLDAAALVAATRRALLELIPHEQAPYALAQQCSAIPPSLPLFTALLNYRHGARGGAALEGIRTVAGYSRTNLPLSLDVDEHRGAFGIGIECVAPLRPDRVAELVLAALEALADALEAAETGRVEPFTSLPLLSAPLRRDIAAAWNAVQPAAVRPHDARPDPHGAVDARWCAGLAALGERLAVEDEAGAWTYAQLGKWVDALAGALDRAGVAPRTRVRIGLPDGRRKLGCALALLTCGCMPDPEDAAAPAMFAIAEGDVDAEGDDAPLWDHLRLRRLAAAAHDGAPRPGHAQARPAATAITLARAVDWLAQAFAPAPEQRIGVAAGLPPLRWLRDACAVLRAGATLVCAPPATTPQGLYGWLERSGVVLFSGSAAHLRLLVRARPAAARTPALRRVLIGGGALFARDVERWRAALPGAPIAHVFGDALSAYTDLCWRDDFEPLGAMYAPLGRPVPGCRVLLCAEDGGPVYPDEPGRLHLSMDADASGTTDGLARAFPDIVMCDGSLLITPAHDVFEQDMAERQGEKR